MIASDAQAQVRTLIQGPEYGDAAIHHFLMKGLFLEHIGSAGEAGPRLYTVKPVLPVTSQGYPVQVAIVRRITGADTQSLVIVIKAE